MNVNWLRLCVSIFLIILLTGCGNELKRINTISDLENSNVGVYASSEYDTLIMNIISSVTPKYYDSYADQISALKSGKIDAIVTDEPLAKEILKNTTGIKILGNKITEDSYAFPISPSKKKLQIEINEIMKKMEDEGKFEYFENKWMGDDESVKKLEEYSNTDKTKGVLKFGTVSTIAPFSYIKNNEVVGYDIDVINYICNELGYELKIIEMSFDGIVPSLVSNKIDVAGGSIIATEERKKTVLFSIPDYTGGVVLLVRDDEK